MGAEQSTASVDGGLGWGRLSIGLRLSREQVAVWPQLQPLVLWFTEDDALALLARLHRRKQARFLTLQEFHAWVRSDSGSDASAVDEDPIDIMTPPSLRHKPAKNNNRKQPALRVLALMLDHVFATFAGQHRLLYAMEFLAAMVVGSRAIWQREHKCRVLLALFQDVAAKTAAFKLADLAQLFYCVLQGSAKLTVGLRRHWQCHGVDLQRQSRRLATDAFAFHTLAPTGHKLTLAQVLAFVDATPTITRFLSLFSGEELRNPSTFGDAVAYSAVHRPAIALHQQQYDALLASVVSQDGRSDRRRHAAALLIQSAWRRRCCQSLAERARAQHQRQRHASAATLQQFVRQRYVAKILEQHAEAEALAANGGVFFGGHGACTPTISASSSATSATPSPLRLVDAFKLQGVKISMVAMSKSCCVAVGSDRQSLFAWGRCLPRVYADSVDGSATLTRSAPARLAHRFPAASAVVDVACGLSHALVVTSDGNVHSWGFNDHGQLGHGAAATLLARTSGKTRYESYYDDRDGREYEYLPQPTTLVYFQGSAGQQAEPIPITRVVCGDYYSLALSEDGDVFSWGEASEGQLGHGDAHARFQVALVDRHMLNSAYTFLAEPEPVLGLSDTRIVQVACRKNHSVALAQDGRVFEWGHWGKRLGHDQEHAFAPVELQGVSALALRQLSVGDHHIVAEGSSVWLTLPGRVDGLRGPHHVYLALSPAWSCPPNVIAERFCTGKPWTCVLAEIDIDDLTVDDAGENKNMVENEGTGEEEEQSSGGGPDALWMKRATALALTEPSVIAAFDSRVAEVLQCFPGLARKFAYDRMLMLWLHGHVQDRLVVMPRGKPPGYYLQVLLPKDTLPVYPPEENEESEGGEHSTVRMVEFPVVAATTCENKVTRTGFATHVFHATMRERLALLPRRLRRAMPTDYMEPNSVYLIEFNESTLDGENDSVDEEDRTDPVEGTERFFTRSSTPDGRQSFTWTDWVVQAMARRVLAAQEAGALAVLIVLDFLDADAFALDLAPASGVYIPVFMVKKSAVASRTHDDKALAFSDVLEQFIAAQTLDDEALEDADEPPTLPPAWITRCFLREDTTARRIQSAVANGAAGVILIQDPQSVEMDGETAGAPVFLDPPGVAKMDRMVAMVSWQNGEAIRAASALTPTARPMPFVASDGNKCELVVDVGVAIRPGGSVYAWGNGQQGRLGVGDPALPPLRDGYEALTDSSYRFTDRPTPVVALAGHELKQIVCGSGHTVAVTQEGRVFTWGKGTKGELGSARTKDQPMVDQWVPRELHHLRYERIVSAAANDAATLLLSELVDSATYLERRKEIAQLRAVARKSVLL